ncbi:HDOD domain-containing protein [Pseudomonas matsuisoli]|uniref:HDOD domain-containing protein n=1 Tax=Pseudomonas matsuisoli TaxID=1515666 RepID=A0A917USQ2_9PSED|nr:HDOD domain-containing protein [Pseudomonas matsuisoli]GGJ82292.1 HDOD domain-containing protein [Pseudomonas matsuisoli]
MNTFTHAIQDELIDAIENDRLVLPTLPEVALRVREAAEDPDIGVPQLAKVIGNDAALSARIIKIVNSPLLRTSKEINDLQTAVGRLGINYTCNLATGLAMEQMFQATSDAVDRRLREVWTRSTEIAGICTALCRHYTRLPADQAMLAGLVHQIGALPILTFAEEQGNLLNDAISLDRLISKLHPILGEKILRTWDFPAPIAVIPTQHLDFTRDSKTTDYTDIVQVAVLQSYQGSEHPFAQIDWTTVPAFTKLGMDPSANVNEDEDLSEAMAAATRMLQG